MSELEIVRAWKDPIYRAGLDPGLLAAAASPIGDPALSDEELADASWQAQVLTTAMTCTELTFRGWRRCCP
jgi:mersacidin/lichenicidin family type 2 lantibiotic